jgi:hypothetical protein
MLNHVFGKKLRQARVRCALDVLLAQVTWVGLGMGVLALIGLLIQRLLSVTTWQPWVGYAAAGVAGALVLALCWIKLPRRLQVSLLLDERLGLNERFSTALALEASDDPFVQCAREEALAAVQTVQPSQCIAIRPGSAWWGTLLTWVVFVTVFFFLPQRDLLGLNEKKELVNQEKAKIELAEKQIQEATATVKLTLDKMDSPELQEDLAGLAAALKGGEPQAAKRQVIRKLGDMSDKLNSLRNSMDNQSMDLMKQMMRQLRSSPNAMSQQLNRALAKGEFNKAASLLRQLQQQMMKGDMTDQQKKNLDQQLKNLSKQLQALAKKRDELEDELEKQGLDKKLASLTPEALKKALQDKGLTPEMINDLLKKMAASQMASSRASNLGQCLGGGAGGGAGGLSEALAELDELGDLADQIQLSEAMLAELERAIACLGEGMCQGLGGQAPFREGDLMGQGPGSGGPGRGNGPRGTADDGETATKKTIAKSKTQAGPVVASWYFQGEQIKGQATKTYSQVIQDAGASASEAINDNTIPRKYDNAIKAYFGQLESQKPGDGS